MAAPVAVAGAQHRRRCPSPPAPQKPSPSSGGRPPSRSPTQANPRVISDAAVEKVALSIEEYGWRQPIVVDEAGVIIAGHTRLRAAQKLGRETVPVHVAAGLSAAQVKGLRLMDNRSSEESGWDDALLVAELDELLGLDFDITYAGFEEDLERGARERRRARPCRPRRRRRRRGARRGGLPREPARRPVDLRAAPRALRQCHPPRRRRAPARRRGGGDVLHRPALQRRHRPGLEPEAPPAPRARERRPARRGLRRVPGACSRAAGGGGDRRRLLRHGRRRVAGARPRDARRRPAPLGDDHLGQGLLRARAQQVPPPLRADLVRLARERDQLATPPAATRTTSGSSRAPSAARSIRR